MFKTLQAIQHHELSHNLLTRSAACLQTPSPKSQALPSDLLMVFATLNVSKLEVVCASSIFKVNISELPVSFHDKYWEYLKGGWEGYH